MTIYTWPNNVNNKFFSFSKQQKENVIMSEFLSGRVTGFKKNTVGQFKYNAKLVLTKQEEVLFWNWFENVSLNNCFSCSVIGDGYYRFISVPSPDDTDQVFTTLSLEFEDVI